MLKVELITIPGTGTRSVEKWITQQFGLENYPKKKNPSGVLVSTHFEPDRIAINRILNQEDTLILSTWRDPLRIVIHNLYKGRKHIVYCFEMLYELRRKRPVIMVDLKCIPYHEGEGEVLRPCALVENDGGALRKAYFDRDIKYIEDVIPGYIEYLRKFDWKDLPTEEWWR